jgi:2-dehydro-3-deoxyphosphogluconate aldolase/(4S)-4-hydroxy-2-oxoglutarate aldolase
MPDSIPDFKSPILPVVDALPLAEALLAGGVDVIEITLRRPGGLPGIQQICSRLSQICVGAGTLLTGDDVARACDAGASFGLSPGSVPVLVDAVMRHRLPFIPGVATPSEVMQAHAAGFTLMKLFPAHQLGGIGMLSALRGPFPTVRFCPTGGVSPENLANYLALPNVAMIGGSWLTPPELVANRQWQAITALARQAIETAREATQPLRPTVRSKPSQTA